MIWPYFWQILTGTGSSTQTLTVTMSGGGIAGGSASVSFGRAFISSGGVLAGGTPSRSFGRSFVASKGGIVGGGATYALNGISTMSVAMAGGGVAGGSATISTHNVLALTVVMSGGGIAGGTPARSFCKVLSMSGGGLGGGAATCTLSYASQEVAATVVLPAKNLLSLSQMRALVRSTLNEFGSYVISDTDLDSLINDGYRDVAYKSACIQDCLEKDPIVNSRYVEVGDCKVDYVELIIYDENDVETSRRTLMKITPTLIGYAPNDDDYPQFFFQWGRHICLEPLPITSDCSLLIYVSGFIPEEFVLVDESLNWVVSENDEEIYATGSLMVEDDEVPFALPPEFCESIVLHAAAFAMMKLRRWTEAAMLYNAYITDIKFKKDKYITVVSTKRSDTLIPDTVTRKAA